MDFRKDGNIPPTLDIGGVAVEVVTSYLGVHISNELARSNNTASLIKKSHQRFILLEEIEACWPWHFSPYILLQIIGGECPHLLYHCVVVKLFCHL